MNVRRFGIVCSAGGSAFIHAFEILREAGHSPDATLVTDRECEVEYKCDLLNIPRKRFEGLNRVDFSKKTADWLFGVQKVSWVCLFFSKLVSSDLFDKGRCFNIHPSLLPSFPGLRALEKTWLGCSLFQGATAHEVNEFMDQGQVVAQVCAPLVRSKSYSVAERVCFAQKVYLFLVLWEYACSAHGRGTLSDSTAICKAPRPWANPLISDSKIADAFEGFLKREGIDWIR